MRMNCIINRKKQVQVIVLLRSLLRSSSLTWFVVIQHGTRLASCGMIQTEGKVLGQERAASPGSGTDPEIGSTQFAELSALLGKPGDVRLRIQLELSRRPLHPAGNVLGGPGMRIHRHLHWCDAPIWVGGLPSGWFWRRVGRLRSGNGSDRVQGRGLWCIKGGCWTTSARGGGGGGTTDFRGVRVSRWIRGWVTGWFTGGTTATPSSSPPASLSARWGSSFGFRCIPFFLRLLRFQLELVAASDALVRDILVHGIKWPLLAPNTLYRLELELNVTETLEAILQNGH